MLSQVASISQVQTARTAAVQALWGPHRLSRAPEIVLGVLNKPCQVDPFYSGCMNLIRTLARVLRKNDALATRFKYLYTEKNSLY